jgi:tRNA threonylcarbamoyladenosine biosynthesis protein TsaE
MNAGRGRRGHALVWDRPLRSRSPRDTWRLAAALLDVTGPRAVLALHGDLGSGKTCFVQGLALALGVADPVTSPTFTLVNEFVGRAPLYHIDLYRLRDPGEMLAMGLQEYLEADGVTAVEWAERAGDLLPASAVHVCLEPGASPRERRVTFRRAAPS